MTRTGLLPIAMTALLSGVAWSVSPDLRLAFALCLLLLVPGALLAQLLKLCDDSPPLVRAACWPGLSVALVALGYEWGMLADLSVQPWLALAFTALCAAGGLWLLWRAYPSLGRVSPGNLALAAIFLATLVLRFYQIRDLAVPAWVDSLHHALLIRVAVETGQAPLSLAPYLPVEQLSYHWGYHVVSALAFEMAGAPLPEALPRAMLLQGQLISAVLAPAFAGLAISLWRRPLAGIVAALVVGLTSVMPAFYVSWGRYTLLLGLLVLPAALIMLRAAVRVPTAAHMIGAGIALAGLALVHFVLCVYALVWWAVVVVGESPRRPYRLRLAGAGLPIAPLAIAAVLTLPWLLLLAERARPGAGAAATHIAGNDSYNAMPTALLWAGNNRVLLALAATGALFCIARRLGGVGPILLWALAVTALANPPLFGLPYLSFVTNETVAVTLFVPVALLIGGGAAAVEQWMALAWPSEPGRWVRGVVTATALIGCAAWGIWEWRSIVRPDTVLATADDLRASAWVARNTPSDARFLVNTVGWLGDVDRGADGGWWLLPLAARQVSTPPVLYTYAEDVVVARIKQESAWLRTHPDAGAAAIAALMRAGGFTHVYATEGGRPLAPARLRESALFEEIYAAGRVAIFRLR